MAYQGIGTGTAPNDNSGDSLLDGAIKINANFTEIYTALGDGTNITFDSSVIPETITTTSVNKTLSNLEYCTVTSGGLSLTLPTSPATGNKVMIGISSNYTDTNILRNGSNIMGLAEDMLIDIGYGTLTLIYINSTLGWRIS